MSTVNFLPGAPVFSIFVSLILFFAAIYKSPKLSSGVLSIIVLISIIYQLTGFQVWNLRSQGLIVVMLSVGALLINLLSARLEATAMAIAVLAVAIMFTPYYYLSVAFIVAAAVVGAALAGEAGSPRLSRPSRTGRQPCALKPFSSSSILSHTWRTASLAMSGVRPARVVTDQT
jgi:hypothetical protein